jgi:hypothetical protein
MEEMVAEETTMEEALVVDNSRYFTSIGFNGGGSYDLASVAGYRTLQPVAGLSLGFNNIKTINKTVGLGLDLDANIVGYIDGSASYLDEALALFLDNTDFGLQILLVPELEFAFGDFGIDLGILGGMTLVDVPYVGLDGVSPTFPSQFKYGVFTYGAKLGLDYHITDFIAFGLDATATKINDLAITDLDYSVDGTMSLKFTF